MAERTITTLHGRQDLPDLACLYDGFPEMPLISISRSQRKPIANASFIGTVFHGLPTELLRPTFKPNGNYLAFLGRVSPEKGLDKAIAIARAAGIPLKVAAKVDPADEAFFRDVIEPLLSLPGIEFIGEIDERRKSSFLGNALALLFPIEWPEPFGLVMIEAMACGTPVLAFRNGSVPEIIEPGLTGEIVGSTEEAIALLPSVLDLDRRAVRRRFEERFSSRRMTLDYLAHYRALVARSQVRQRESGALVRMLDGEKLAPGLR